MVANGGLIPQLLRKFLTASHGINHHEDAFAIFDLCPNFLLMIE